MSLNWYADDEVLARMPRNEAAARLEAIGEIDVALKLQKVPARNIERESSFGLFSAFSGSTRPWMHATHLFGFLPRSPSAGHDQEILVPGRIEPDQSLRNGRINVTLNRLRIAEYPGRGPRQILFDFSAQNHLDSGVEDAHFNMIFRAGQNSVVGVINYPIFVDLNVGAEGTIVRCFTVNVQNDQDEKLLSALDSEVFKKGLKLATVAQPALAPLSEIAMGITRTVASRYRNVPVQNIQMGLDFGGPQLGARLAQGDYIAVQVPMQAITGWDWSDYKFNPKVGEIVRADDGTPIPYNYFAFGISAYTDSNG
jgi:hypothetical protein